MQLVLDVPEYFAVDFTPTELVEKIKLYSALIMFRSGQISAGAACEFAEIDRYSFLSACKRHGISTVDYDGNELESEVQLNVRGRN